MDLEIAINKMMEMAGYNARYCHLLQMGDYPWYSKYTCTVEEEADFRKWFMSWMFKKLKGKHGAYAKEIAAKHYSSFWFQYGLKTI